MRIEIVSTGDEVITGNIDDTNATFLSQELAECGLEVSRRHTTGDNLSELEAVFTEISQRESLALVTGGLGPTNDDLTAFAISNVAKVPLCLHQEWVERMEEIFKHRGRVMTSSNLKQAMLPQGSFMINNPVGTACGFAIKVNKALFIFAPGVPSELKAMWRQSLKEMVVAAANASRVVHLTTCRYTMTGIGESNLADLIKPLELPEGITFGDRAMHPFLELKLVGRNVEPKLLTDCYEIVHHLLERYVICLGPYDLMSRLNIINLKLPQIHVVDTVCQGLLSIEIQKLNIAIMSSMIINYDLQNTDADKSEVEAAKELMDFKLPEENYIYLRSCENRPEQSGFSYQLLFSLNCKDSEQSRLYKGELRFNFSHATLEHTKTVRHHTFLTLLCIGEMYKLTVGEPLLLPDECNVELVSFSDSKLPNTGRKLGMQTPPDMQSLLTESISKLQLLKTKVKSNNPQV